MTSPAGNTEPTAEQVAAMQRALGFGNGPLDELPDYALHDIVPAACALAAAVHAEREKVAAEFDVMASPMLANDPFIRAADWAARRIREVAG